MESESNRSRGSAGPFQLYIPVKNQPSIVMTTAVRALWHFGSSSAVWHQQQ